MRPCCACGEPPPRAALARGLPGPPPPLNVAAALGHADCVQRLLERRELQQEPRDSPVAAALRFAAASGPPAAEVAEPLLTTLFESPEVLLCPTAAARLLAWDERGRFENGGSVPGRLTRLALAPDAPEHRVGAVFEAAMHRWARWALCRAVRHPNLRAPGLSRGVAHTVLAREWVDVLAALAERPQGFRPSEYALAAVREPRMVEALMGLPALRPQLVFAPGFSGPGSSLLGGFLEGRYPPRVVREAAGCLVRLLAPSELVRSLRAVLPRYDSTSLPRRSPLLDAAGRVEFAHFPLSVALVRSGAAEPVLTAIARAPIGVTANLGEVLGAVLDALPSPPTAPEPFELLPALLVAAVGHCSGRAKCDLCGYGCRRASPMAFARALAAHPRVPPMRVRDLAHAARLLAAQRPHAGDRRHAALARQVAAELCARMPVAWSGDDERWFDVLRGGGFVAPRDVRVLYRRARFEALWRLRALEAQERLGAAGIGERVVEFVVRRAPARVWVEVVGCL